MPFVVFVLLVILSYIGVYGIRRYAENRQLLDHPNDRSSHSAPMPRGGGLAIVLLVTGTGLWSIYACVEPCRNETGLSRNLVYIVCGIVIAWLGWRDDTHSLSPKVRFAIQGIVAIVSIYGFGYFESVTIPLFGVLHLGVVGIVITFLWIVGLTNAYNFMDGIDGIAGGVAFAGGLGWVMLSSNIDYLANSFVFWIGLAMAAGSLGFLGHNWPPAKIFMGDVASTFLGYSFAVLPLLASDQKGDALMLGTLLMWTFIMDAGVTFIQRLLRREKILSAHRSHLYQRLVIGGYTHTMVSFLYIVLTFVAIGFAFEWMHGSQIASGFILFGLPLIWILLSIHASRLGKTLKTTNTKGF